MKFQHRNLLGLTTSFALFFGVLAIGARLVAQETASGETSSAVTSDLMTDDHDHDRGPRNGPLAVATVTIIDGGYGTFQLATLPNDGGPYHFLTTVDTLPNGAYLPYFTPDGKKIFFETFGDETRGDSIVSVPTEGGALTPLQTDCASNDPNCGDSSPAISHDGRELLSVRELGPGVRTTTMAAWCLWGSCAFASTAPSQTTYARWIRLAPETDNRGGRLTETGFVFQHGNPSGSCFDTLDNAP